MQKPLTMLVEVEVITVIVTAVCFLMIMLGVMCTSEPVNMED